MMGLKSALKRLQNQCGGIASKAESGQECTLENLCGTGRHCRGREPYFYDFAYKSYHDNCKETEPEMEPVAAAPIPLLFTDMGRVKFWPCDPHKCILPDEPEKCASRLLELCNCLKDIKEIRKYVDSADKCENCKHVRKKDTPS